MADIDIKIDSSGAAEATESIRGLGDAAEGAASPIDRLERAIKEFAEALRAIKAAGDTTDRSMKDLENSTEGVSDKTDRAQGSARTYFEALELQAKGAGSASKAQQQLTSNMSNARGITASFESQLAALRGTLGNVTAGFSLLGGVIGGFVATLASVKITDVIDEYTRWFNTMKESANSFEEVTAGLKNYVDLANTAGVSTKTMVGLFDALELSKKRLKLTDEGHLSVMRSLAAAAKIENGSLAETEASVKKVTAAITKLNEEETRLSKARSSFIPLTGAGVRQYNEMTPKKPGEEAATEDDDDDDESTSTNVKERYDSATAAIAKQTAALAENSKAKKENSLFTENETLIIRGWDNGLVRATDSIGKFGRNALIVRGQVGELAKTILDQFGESADIIAQKAGFLTGQAMTFAANAGQIGTQQLMKALADAGPQLEELAGKMRGTFERAFLQLTNSIGFFLGHLNLVTGASQTFIAVLDFMRNNVEILVPIVLALGTALSVLATGAVISGLLALANPLILIAAVIAGLIVLVNTFGATWKVNTEGTITVLGIFRVVLGTIWNLMLTIWEVAKQVGNAFVEGFNKASGQATGFKITWEDVGRGIIFAINGIIVAINLMGQFFAPVFNFIGFLLGKIIEGFRFLASVIAQFLPQFKETADTAFKNTTSLLDLDAAFKAASKSAIKFGDDTKDGGEKAGKSIGMVKNEVYGMRDAFDLASLSGRRSFSTIDESAARSASNLQNYASSASNSFNQVGQAAAYAASQVETLQRVGSMKGGGSGLYFPNYVKTEYYTDQSLDTIEGQYGGSGRAFAENVLDVLRGNSHDRATQIGQIRAAAQGNPQLGEILRLMNLREFPGYAQGADFTVAGAGGTDSQLIQFMATPGERVIVIPAAASRSFAAAMPMAAAAASVPGNTTNILSGGTMQVPRLGDNTQRAGTAPPAAAAGPANINVRAPITIVTKDIDSFRRSKTQVALQLQDTLNRAAGRMTR